MIEYLICALRNLGRKKLRTFLTVSGIAIGVSSVIIVGAIGAGGKQAVTNELDSLGINGLNITAKITGSNSTANILSDDDVQTCLSVSGVKSAMPLIMQSGTVEEHGVQKSALYWGVDTDAKNIISINVIHGNMFSHYDITNHTPVCLVDDSFAKYFFKRTNITGEKITVFLGNDYKELTVKGVISSGSSILNNLAGSYMPYFIYLPYTTAEDLRGDPGYDQIAVKTISNNNIDSIGEKIIDVLGQNNADKNYIANNMFKQKQRLSELLNIVTLIISAVGAISLIVAGLGIMTVMTVSVSERTREIGIKKAIGAKKNVIMIEFICEALAISFLGGIIGIVAGAAISWLASAVLQFHFIVQSSSILYSTLFAVAIGVVFGVYPAVKASNLKPVDALRHDY